MIVIAGKDFDLELKKVQLRSNSAVAVSDNKLINACYTMTAMQKRLFNLAISASHSKKFSTGDVAFSVDDFASISNIPLYEALRICQTEAKGLSRTQVIDIKYKERRTNKPLERLAIERREEYADKSNNIASLSYRNFFQEVEVVSDSLGDYFYVKFSKWLLPYIEVLNKKFSKIQISEVNGVSSFYALRLFDLVMSSPLNKSKDRVRVFSLGDLRAVLGLVDERGDLYLNWCDFKRRCLVGPLSELSKQTKYDFSYSLSGRGLSKRIYIRAKERTQLEFDV